MTLQRLGFFTRVLDEADPAERYRLGIAQIVHAELIARVVRGRHALAGERTSIATTSRQATARATSLV